MLMFGVTRVRPTDLKRRVSATDLEEELEEGGVQAGVKDGEEGCPPFLGIPDAGLLVVTGQPFAQPHQVGLAVLLRSTTPSSPQRTHPDNPTHALYSGVKRDAILSARA